VLSQHRRDIKAIAVLFSVKLTFVNRTKSMTSRKGIAERQSEKDI
jgi:hypothetical protein